MSCPGHCDLLQHLPWSDGLVRSFQSALRAVSTVVGASLLVMAVLWSDGMLQLQLAAVGEPVELIYLPPTPFLRAVSLGYEHALADVLWFRTISYFGRHYRNDRLYPWLASMCDAVTDLDPSAEHVYRFGGLILPWEAAFVDDGIALLKKGTRNLPQSWELRYMLGFSYYFFRDDIEAASRTLRDASLLRGAPEFVSRLAALVYAAHEGPNRAIGFLAELERSGMSEEMRGVIHQRMRELALARDIDQLEAAVKGFERRFARFPADVHELVSMGLLTSVPPEPFGGQYVIDARTGQVRSSLGKKPWRLGSSRTREELLKRQHREDSDEAHRGTD